MDIESIRQRARAARQVVVLSRAGRFVLELPTAHAMALAIAQRQEGDAGVVVFLRQRVEEALVDWSGVTLKDFAAGAGDGDGGDTPVPFDRALVPDLLDAQPDLEALLRETLVVQLAERRARVEAAAKN